MKPQSNRWQWLRLAYLLPIVGVTIALNAETVTNMVYKNDEPQKQVPVKKGKKDATIKTNANQGIQVIEVIEAPEAADKEKTYETTVNQEDEQNVAVIVYDSKPEGEKPLLIVDGKIATIDQVRALPRDYVARMAMMRPKAAIKSYGPDAKNGAIIITTPKRQEEIDNESVMPDVYDVVEEMPKFPGGQIEMLQYLAKSLQYPEEAEKAGKQGRVIATFVVEKDGSITNARVVKSVDPLLDAEALRVINAMPKWNPGKQNGLAVRCKYTVPLTFHLDGKDFPRGESRVIVNGADKSAEEQAYIDENGRILINGKEVKRYLFDGSQPYDNKLTRAIVNIIINDAEHFDYVIDGEPVSAKDLQDRKSKNNPIKSIEYVQKDSEHPKDRLLITTKEK